MKSISFVHNWNKKLDCDVFTTIRSNTDVEKYAYYYKSIGEVFQVLLNGVDYGRAELLGVNATGLGFIGPELLMVDTGTVSVIKALEIFESFGLNSHSPVLVLAFRKV